MTTQEKSAILICHSLSCGRVTSSGWIPEDDLPRDWRAESPPRPGIFRRRVGLMLAVIFAVLLLVAAFAAFAGDEFKKIHPLRLPTLEEYNRYNQKQRSIADSFHVNAKVLCPPCLKQGLSIEMNYRDTTPYGIIVYSEGDSSSYSWVVCPKCGYRGRKEY